MISLIEAKNYRCLRYVRQPLEPFQVLVGPNASGKTTFLDVVAFLSDLLSGGLDHALSVRTKNFDDLLWQRNGDEFQMAVELTIPERLVGQSGPDEKYDTARYELSIKRTQDTEEIIIGAERLLLQMHSVLVPVAQGEFPQFKQAPASIFAKASRRIRTVTNKKPGGNDNFYSEVYTERGKGWAPSYKLGPRKSALGNLPEDESKFPVATWVKSTLTEGIQRLMLNSLAIRMASPPGRPRTFQPDGSNLPWVIEDLVRKNPERFKSWIAHLQTALHDLVTVRTVEREDDKHRYLVLEYAGGLSVPSWMASDGTLRLLALTLPAYLTGISGTYLIEEPENGIHPRAVQTMFESLSSVYDAQVLCATHSPVVLGLVEPHNVLCFAKTIEGATDIVSGGKHPALVNWNRQVTLSEMFAAGVLG
jgi:predicted ATPase